MAWWSDDRSQNSAPVRSTSSNLPWSSSSISNLQKQTCNNKKQWHHHHTCCVPPVCCSQCVRWWMCDQILPAHGDQIPPLYGSDPRCCFFTSPVKPEIYRCHDRLFLMHSSLYPHVFLSSDALDQSPAEWLSLEPWKLNKRVEWQLAWNGCQR